jgi:hypothetical protein
MFRRIFRYIIPTGIPQPTGSFLAPDARSPDMLGLVDIVFTGDGTKSSSTSDEPRSAWGD